MKDVTGDAAAVDQHADALLEMLDTSQMQGTTCALLTPAIKAKLRELQPGQVLEIRVDDPLARDDIASWCRLAGHEMLEAVEEGPRLRVFLRKKPD